MLGNSRGDGSQLRWRLVWVTLGLIGLPGVIAVLTLLLLSAPSASGGGAKPALNSSLSGQIGSATCASTNRDPVDSTRAGARASLVPPGAEGVLLCRYGPRSTRVGERSISSGAIVSQLAWELNALPPATGTYACPSDNGESITADFSYQSGAENPVSVGLSGCQQVSNGHVNRLGLDRPVVAQLARLVPWQGTVQGRLVICGGPAPGRCRSTSGFGACLGTRCLEATQVAISPLGVGTPAPNARLHRGRFVARLAPGRYRLSLVATGRGGQFRMLDTVRVRVRQMHTTRMAFRLSVP